jgi:hypothetical protein
MELMDTIHNQDDIDFLIKRKTKFLLDLKYPLDLAKIIIHYQECIICDQSYSIIRNRLLSLQSTAATTINNILVQDKIEFDFFDDRLSYDLRLYRNSHVRFSVETHSISHFSKTSEYSTINIDLENFICCIVHQIPIHKMNEIDNLTKIHLNNKDDREKEKQNDSDNNNIADHSELRWKILSNRLRNYLIFNHPLKSINFEQKSNFNYGYIFA